MKKKKLLIIVLVVLVLIIILLIVGGKRKQEIRVTAEKAEQRNLIETITANGTIQPKINVTITPYISGEITELNVKEGDKVKPGDLLVKIDPRTYVTSYKSAQATLNQMKANEANARAKLSQSKANLIQNELEYRRNKKLFDQKVIAEADFDKIKAMFQVALAELDAAKEAVKAAQYSVENSQANLDEAKENLSRTNVYAPTEGTVAQLVVQQGERVTGNSQFSAGTVMMAIANLDSLEVHVDVNENDIVRVALGDTAVIEIDAYLNKSFKGIVTEIATSSENNNLMTSSTGASSSSSSSIDQVTNFSVKVLMLKDSYADLNSRDQISGSPFRPGMSANVDIQTDRVNNVLSIPIQAVTTRKNFNQKSNDTTNTDALNTQEYVFIVHDDKAKIKHVTTGIQNNKYIEIKSGIDDKEKVITGPYNAVSKQLENDTPVQEVSSKVLFNTEKK